MKKIFIKPEIKKMELDLSENIATSGQEFVISTFLDAGNCVIVHTDIAVGTEVTKEEIKSCITYLQSRMGGTVATPLEEMRYFIRY